MSRFIGNAIGRTSGPVPEASGGDAVLLYNCNGCWSGSAVIPAEKLGVYSRYEFHGQTGYWQYYCSQMALSFGGACGGACAANPESYTSTQCSCGWVGDSKCYNTSEQYACAGHIAWIFGCSSGCTTACAQQGYLWQIAIEAENVCDGSQRNFTYCSRTSMTGDVSICCIGVRNSGRATNCCGAHPACLKGVCLTTPSSGNPFGCATSMQIYGYGKHNV
jgi:hypothetical protein